MFHVCIAHCMPEKIHKMSKCDNSCLFVWSTVVLLASAIVVMLRLEQSALDKVMV